MKYEGSIEELSQDNHLPSTGAYTYIGKVQLPEKGIRAKYVFHCSTCAKDEELFGKALFWTGKADFYKGQIFCGCSSRVIWTEEQVIIKSKRVCLETGNVFRGIIQPFIGTNSRCSLYCPECKHSWTSKLSNLWALKRGCLSCRDIKFRKTGSEASKKEDEVVIRSFMDTGHYPEGTTFVKITRKAKNTRNNYWMVNCPVCNRTAECQQGHLLRGTTSCDCSVLNKKESYINIIKDGDNVLAIKFGISKNSQKRLASHKYNTVYDVDMFCVFKYEDSSSCKAAEQECKDSLVCGVISRDLFKAGWTETTYPYNLDRVIATFERYGGIRVV